MRPTLAVLFAVLGLLGGPASVGSAPLPHFVYGLDPRFSYGVSLGEEQILVGAVPGTAGDLHFGSQGETSVHIAALRLGPDPIAFLPSDTVLLLQGPFPNPIRDRAELLITTAIPGSARFRLYDPLAGRTSFDVATPLQSGRNSVWIEFPSRIGSGIYLLRVDLPQETIARKVVFIRR